MKEVTPGVRKDEYGQRNKHTKVNGCDDQSSLIICVNIYPSLLPIPMCNIFNRAHIPPTKQQCVSELGAHPHVRIHTCKYEYADAESFYLWNIAALQVYLWGVSGITELMP
jgi:hypothetical protein